VYIETRKQFYEQDKRVAPSNDTYFQMQPASHGIFLKKTESGKPKIG
jgi:hypothetical protein